MNEQKFIAISEDEYNSFKHGEYARKIRDLKEEIERLKKEKEAALRAKGTILKITNSSGICDTTQTVELISNENFENEILEAIKNTEFKHVFTDVPWSIFSGFDKERDYIQIGDTYYYRNEWCERIKNELKKLSSEVKCIQMRRDELKAEVAILEQKTEPLDDMDREENILKAIINKFSK